MLYNLGNQQRELYVTVDDFYWGESVITISYEFRNLTTDQKGTFYEYVVLGETEEQDFARITISYHYCPIKIGFKIRVIFCRQRLQVKNLLFQYGGSTPFFYVVKAKDALCVFLHAL